MILHPADFSNCSDCAFQIAADLARQNAATLLVLHVVETLGPENVTFGEAASQLEPEGYRQRLETDLRCRAPAPEGIETRYLLAAGDSAGEIQRVAREHSCDLIVMGTHGRTGLRRLLMGSIAEKVVRQAPCPVLVVRIPVNSPA
jgi:nucleotide-binding universal stress UspA family protein